MGQERDIILSRLDWPIWPLLPLKRRGSDLLAEDACGFLLAVEAPPFNVYVANMYFASGKTVADIDREFPKRSYESIDTLLAEWAVD